MLTKFLERFSSPSRSLPQIVCGSFFFSLYSIELDKFHWITIDAHLNCKRYLCCIFLNSLWSVNSNPSRHQFNPLQSCRVCCPYKLRRFKISVLTQAIILRITLSSNLMSTSLLLRRILRLSIVNPVYWKFQFETS